MMVIIRVVMIFSMMIIIMKMIMIRIRITLIFGMMTITVIT